MKNKYAGIAVPTKRRTQDEITAENQMACRVFYATAREEFAQGNLTEALYWQNGAAGHWPKVAHRMGIAQILWP